MSGPNLGTSMKTRTSMGTVSYEQVGGGPDLVLLHSLLSDRRVFERVVPRLAVRHRVTLVDLPGFGETDLVEPGIENYADVVGVLLDTLELDPESTTVLGNGLGGFVALGAAVYHGDSFHRLVIAGAGAGFAAESKVAFETMIDKVEAGGMEAILDIAVQRIFTQAYLDQHPEEAAQRREVLRGTDPEAFTRACRTLISLDLRDAVRRIDNPTLIVVGSEDVATPPAMGRDLGERIPGSSVEVLAGLAHAPQLQDPDRFLSAVMPFLDSA